MIILATEAQYQNTKQELAQFEQALALVDVQNADLHPLLRQAMKDGMASTIIELQAQITDYEQRAVKRQSA